MAGGSSLCPCSVLLGAALTQPLVLSLQHLGAAGDARGDGQGGEMETGRMLMTFISFFCLLMLRQPFCYIPHPFLAQLLKASLASR